MMRTAEYQRGYDAGYKQALLDAVKGRSEPDLAGTSESLRRFEDRRRKIERFL